MSTMRGFLRVVIDADDGWCVGAEQGPFGGPTGHLTRDGAPRVPVTGLIGSFRDHLRRQGDDWDGWKELAEALGCGRDVVLERLLGPSAPEKEDNATEVEGLSASALWGLSADVGAAKGEEIETVSRGRTAINRSRGAAEASTLRDRSLVSVPTVIVLRLRLDACEPTLKAVAGVLATWRPTIGGGRSTGSGTARVREVWYGAVNLAEPPGRERYWSMSGRNLVDAIAATRLQATAAAPRADRIAEVTFSFPEGVRVTTGRRERKLTRGQDPAKRAEACLASVSAAVEADVESQDPAARAKACLARIRDHFVVPGSTWKGIVRSRFEYVLRTVAGRADDADPDASRRALACEDRDSCTKPASGQGGRTLPPCIACRVFGFEGRAGELVFHDSTIEHADAAARNRVAIDRFTGGAYDGALFAETSLVGRSGGAEGGDKSGGAAHAGGGSPELDAWTTMVIERAPEKPGDLLSPAATPTVAAAVRKALAWALRDLGDGLVGIGSRVTTGLGTLKLVEAGTWPVEEDTDGAATALTRSDIDALRSAAKAEPPESDPAPPPPKRGKQEGQSRGSAGGDSAGVEYASPGPAADGAIGPETGTLVAHGEVPWAEAAQIGAGMTAVWFGLEGASVGAIPADPPPGATHLWAWTPDRDRMLRFRIEDDKAIVGELRTAKEPPTCAVAGRLGVEYKTQPDAPTWSPQDGRPGPGNQAFLAGYRTFLAEVLEATPLEFVALKRG
ncbi:MAG: RAMP superfamily CRISPR-associated protein [Bifidobacteriaceae bacterium]|jgi:hypothetical protein|nr:RAMP superfamily CRISPR-associated protein [Bifidobacteriaceae bacterium]